MIVTSGATRVSPLDGLEAAPPVPYWLKIPRSELALGGCCISATLRDYGRIGMLALRDGVAADGTPLVPDGWIRESVRPSPANPEYGLFWWLHGNGSFSADGAYGQQIRVVPAERIVIAIQSYWPQTVTDELIDQTNAFVDALVAFAAPSAAGHRN